MNVFYITPNGSRTQACDRYERTPGEGINGPHVLTFYATTGEGDDAVESVVAGASRVIEFHEVEEAEGE